MGGVLCEAAFPSVQFRSHRYKHSGQRAAGCGGGTDFIRMLPLPVTCIVRTWALFLIFQSQMICIRGDCGPPPVIEHTQPVTETSRAHGDNVIYNCDHNAGYYELPDKGRTITCQNDDTWTTVSEFCARACGLPTRLDFAVPKDSDLKDIYPSGTKVSYDCRLGYKRVPRSNNSIICLDNYTWSIPSEFCTRKECGNPGDTPNGEFNATNGFFFGSRVTYYCNEGYRSSSRRKYRDCQADGTWSNEVPQCEAVLCTAPDSPVDGSYTQVKDEYSFQDTVSFQCNKGLHIIGASTASCTSDGTWSASPPFCKAIICDDAGQIQNGRKKSGFVGPYTLNSAVTYECNMNLVMNGSSTIICNVNGQWEPELPQCLTVCDTPPKFDNAVLEEHFTNIIYFDKTTVFYKCKPGYQSNRTKDNEIMCTVTSWSKRAEFCLPISCGDPGEVRNARRLVSQFTFGSRVHYECEDGYEMTSSTHHRECRANGIWTSEPIICTARPPTGLSTGGKIGIGVACAIVGVMGIFLVWHLCKSKKSGEYHCEYKNDKFIVKQEPTESNNTNRKTKMDTDNVHYVACDDA